MAAFLLADIEVLDPDLYQEYARQVGEIVSLHGGKYVIQSEEIRPFSGDWLPERILVVRFPSREACEACLGSPEYAAIGQLRERSARSRSVVVEY